MKLLKIIGVGAIVVLSVLFYGERQAKEQVQSKNQHLKDSIELQNDSIATLDSAYTVESNKSDSLAKEVKRFKNLWWLEKKAKEDIKDKYDSLRAEVDSMSIDTLAQYIVDHYAGDNYELLDIGFVKGDSSIYIAFQDITAKDIVDKHVDYREQKEVIDNQKSQIKQLNNINGIREDQIAILKDRNGNLELQVDKLKEVREMYKDLAVEHTEEIERQKKLKVIGYSVAIAEGLAILILL